MRIEVAREGVVSENGYIVEDGALKFPQAPVPVMGKDGAILGMASSFHRHDDGLVTCDVTLERSGGLVLGAVSSTPGDDSGDNPLRVHSGTILSLTLTGAWPWGGEQGKIVEATPEAVVASDEEG